MRAIIICLMFLIAIGNITGQEKKQEKKVTNAKSISLRSNSRQQAIVKRDNFHQRRDIRMQQMKRMMKMSKQQRRDGKRAIIKQKINRNPKALKNKSLQQKKLQQQKMKKQQRQRAMRKKMKR